MTNLMTTKIDVEYFEWLTSQIAVPNGRSYRDLFEVMHNVEFHWTVPNDDNRIEDGLDLRGVFLDGRAPTRFLKESGATMLEILVSLSQRVEFAAGGRASSWAWKLLKNLHLTKKSDPMTDKDLDDVLDILDTLIWRTYKADGRGGFFPLNHPEEDQTKVEIWYQMNKYLIEREL
jgi:hypothetical protein